MTVVLASSTSTQAELDHAASENWRTPPAAEEVAQVPAKDAPASAPEVEEKDETAAETETAENNESQGPTGRRGRYQRKIDRLVSSNTELESQLTEARRKIEELSAGRETRKPEPQAAGEPKQEQFSSVDEFIKARVQWELKQEQIREQQAEAEERQKELTNSFKRREVELKAEHDDYEQYAYANLTIPTAVLNAIIDMGEEGPDVAYYLGKHPEVAEELCNLSQFSAVRRLGVIATQISKESEKDSHDEKPRIKPPAPVRPVDGSSQPSISLDSDQISPGEYVRIRNQQVRERMGRRR